MDLDQYRELTPHGWAFRFPNGWMPSVIRQPNNPFHLEIYLGVGVDAQNFAVDYGGNPDGLIGNLTTQRAERIVETLAGLARRTTDDINGS